MTIFTRLTKTGNVELPCVIGAVAAEDVKYCRKSRVYVLRIAECDINVAGNEDRRRCVGCRGSTPYECVDCIVLRCSKI